MNPSNLVFLTRSSELLNNAPRHGNGGISREELREMEGTFRRKEGFRDSNIEN